MYSSMESNTQETYTSDGGSTTVDHSGRLGALQHQSFSMTTSQGGVSIGSHTSSDRGAVMDRSATRGGSGYGQKSFNQNAASVSGHGQRLQSVVEDDYESVVSSSNASDDVACGGGSKVHPRMAAVHLAAAAVLAAMAQVRQRHIIIMVSRYCSPDPVLVTSKSDRHGRPQAVPDDVRHE